MINKIVVDSIEKKQYDDSLEVAYKLFIRGNEYTLTYRISGDEIDSVPLLCDTVIVSFLVYAVKFGLSFYSEYPVSERLYYNLTKHVIPQMSISKRTQNNIIQINAPLTAEEYHGRWVGTGISLGIDSFATIHEYKEDCSLNKYELTHLVHLKTGAHHGQLGYYDQQKEDELFLAENKKVKEFCAEQGYKLIVIESNLYMVTSTEFGYGFDTTHTFRNLGCILLLQNMFYKYYYASTYNLNEFELNLDADTAHYEKWVIPYISNENLEFYSANTNMTRIQKTQYISRFHDTYDNLHVCWYAIQNCGRCKKCIRTLVTMDVLGVLDKYANSFNLDHYYQDRELLISEVILLRTFDSHYMEIYKFMLEQNFPMPSIFVIAKAAVGIILSRIKRLGFSHTLKTITRKMIGK